MYVRTHKRGSHSEGRQPTHANIRALGLQLESSTGGTRTTKNKCGVGGHSLRQDPLIALCFFGVFLRCTRHCPRPFNRGLSSFARLAIGVPSGTQVTFSALAAWQNSPWADDGRQLSFAAPTRHAYGCTSTESAGPRYRLRWCVRRIPTVRREFGKRQAGPAPPRSSQLSKTSKCRSRILACPPGQKGRVQSMFARRVLPGGAQSDFPGHLAHGF